MTINNKKHLDFFDKIILYFITISLLIDIINGAIIYFTETTISFGQLIKTPILILIITRNIQQKKNSDIALFFIIYIIFISISITLNFTKYQINSIFSDLFVVIKPLFMFAIYFWLKNIVRYGSITTEMIVKIININIFFITLNQIIGLIGYGYSSYIIGAGRTIGTSGFFYSGNEYAIVMMLVFATKLYFTSYSSKKSYITWVLFLTIVAMTTAIKTAILGTFLIAILIPTLKHLSNLFKVAAAVFLIGLFLLRAFPQIRYTLPLAERLIWIYHNEGILTLLLSGRDEYLKIGLNLFANQYSLLDRLFGIGYYRLNQLAVHPEMDMFDILFMFGIFGVFIMYAPFLFILSKNIKLLNKRFTQRFVSLISLLLIFISFFAGHLIFSVAAAPFIAIILTININNNENIANF